MSLILGVNLGCPHDYRFGINYKLIFTGDTTHADSTLLKYTFTITMGECMYQ